MSRSGTDEAEKTRRFLIDTGLLPEISAPYAFDDARAERIRQLVTTRIAVNDAHVAGRAHRLVSATFALLLVMTFAMLDVSTAPAIAHAFPVSISYSLASPESLDDGQSGEAALALVSTVATQSDRNFGYGDVNYVTNLGWLPAISFDGDEVVVEVSKTVTEYWTAADGSGRVSWLTGPALGFDGIAKPAGARRIGREGVESYEISVGEQEPNRIANLPRDPDEFRETLLGPLGLETCRTPEQRAWCLANEIAILSFQYVIPGDLANTMWRTLAQESTVKDLGTANDRIGRPVHAVAVASPPEYESREVLVLLISPETGQLIGTETVTLWNEELGITAPTVTAFQTQLASRFVREIGDTE